MYKYKKKRPSPGGWTMYEKYCPECEKGYSWSYERCKICGEKLVTRKNDNFISAVT